MLNENIKILFDLIKKSQKFLLITHGDPDGDAIGSILAMQNFLLSFGKNVTSFCIDKPNKYFNYLQGIEAIKNNIKEIDNEYDLCIFLDCGELHMSKTEHKISQCSFKFGIINIDHHITNPNYGDINIVIPKASSTSEILYQLLKLWKINIATPIATSLLTGIITDTGNFTNNATTKQSIDIAAKLLSIGADFEKISKANVYNKTINILKLWGLVLKRIIFNKNLSMVTTALFDKDLQSFNLEKGADEGISNYLNNLSKNIKFSLLLKDDGLGNIKGSLRTTREDIDVSKIAQTFGGGGHKKAAGFEINGHVVFNNGKWQIIKS